MSSETENTPEVEEDASAGAPKSGAGPDVTASQDEAQADSMSNDPGSTAPPQKTNVLSRGEERFRLLVESVKDYAIFMLDPQGYITSWNTGAQKLKGYTEQEILGKHFSIFYTPPDIERNHPQEELEEAIQKGKYEEEGWRVRKDGSQFWTNVVITPVYDESRELVGFSKVTRDLTERREAELRLRKANEDLEQRVRERTAELETLNIALQRETRLKDEFLAILAHELRNPIGAVSNALHVMNRAAPDSLSFHKAKDVALRQIQHQTRIVDDLLDVSRITLGKIQLRQETLDLAPIVSEAVESHRLAIEEAGVTLTLDLPGAEVIVVGDPTRLLQVFSNLLDNARKFTSRGGWIKVHLESDSENAVVSVSDNGAGIDEELLHCLFEPFAQADRTLARTQAGLGLGLAVVQGLVEQHHGTVRAMSEGQGKGARFEVQLPMPAALGSAAGSDERSRMEFGKGIRVLVIEDNPDAAETLRDLMELLGFNVELTYSGEEGVQRAAEFHPQVILCDIGLPGMSGYEVATRLRHFHTPRPLMLAVTGYGSSVDESRSRAAGFDDHLTKPVQLDKLQLTLDRHSGIAIPRAIN